MPKGKVKQAINDLGAAFKAYSDSKFAMQPSRDSTKVALRQAYADFKAKAQAFRQAAEHWKESHPILARRSDKATLIKNVEDQLSVTEPAADEYIQNMTRLGVL